MDKVETIFEILEIALVNYRQSLKDIEDEPRGTAKQYAKDATLHTNLRLSIEQGLNSLEELELQLPLKERESLRQRRLALKQEYDNLVDHPLTA